MNRIVDLYETTAMRAKRATPTLVSLFVGELKGYNPSDNTVDVYLPHVDASSTADMQTYHMPLMVGITGPSYGEQNGPDTTLTPPLQVLVASCDPEGDDFIALGFLYTANQTAPGAPATEQWRIDKRGSSFKMTADGGTVGDGVGGVKSVAVGYHSLEAGAGSSYHSHVMDVANQFIRQQTAGGHYDLYDDAGHVISRVSAGGSQHIMDDTQDEVSTLATNVTLGARLSAMSSANAALRHTDLATFQTSLLAQRLADQVLLVGLLNAVGTMTSMQLSTALVSLVTGFLPGIGVPAGSAIVKISN